MPRLAVCSRDLHWHWINWTLLCDTMEVSMLRLAWLPIAQHVFQPALTDRLELISRKIVSSEHEQRLSWWADFTKLNARSYRDFAKNIALLGATSAKFAKSVGKTMGSNMRPRYIQFRDIHDRDILGLHCNKYSAGFTLVTDGFPTQRDSNKPYKNYRSVHVKRRSSQTFFSYSYFGLSL